MRTRTGLKSIRSAAEDVQGASQLFLVATCRSCRWRQSRTPLDAPSINTRIPDASDGSAVFSGSKTNARSLMLLPSPFTSPATVGVYGIPEVNVSNQFNGTTSNKLYPKLTCN